MEIQVAELKTQFVFFAFGLSVDYIKFIFWIFFTYLQPFNLFEVWLRLLFAFIGGSTFGKSLKFLLRSFCYYLKNDLDFFSTSILMINGVLQHVINNSSFTILHWSRKRKYHGEHLHLHNKINQFLVVFYFLPLLTH